MTNNDILRRIRYIFDYSDAQMIEIFSLGSSVVSKQDINALLAKEEDPIYQKSTDKILACFLNGLITHKRGKKDGPEPIPEKKLNNNIIFVKLKIALNLQADDIVEILRLAEIKFSKSELSAFFRRKGHKHYRECQDQVLRNFLMGLQIKYR